MTSQLPTLGVDREQPGRGTSQGRAPGRRRRPLVVLGVVAITVLALGAAALYGLWTGIDRSIERFPSPFEALPEQARPEAAEPPARGLQSAVTYLLVGSDSRISAGDPSTWVAGAQRTDAIMLVHVPADRSGAAVVSIPRDSWVQVPGHGQAKVNAAYSFGGPALLVRTVEQLTGVRVDHVAVVDFTGFVAMTDALGGVDVTVAEDTADSRHAFTAGEHHMDGETALDYVRQRVDLPGGDLDRVRRQQNWVRAVMSDALSQGLVRDPLALHAFLRAMTGSLAVDEGWGTDEMADLALDLRGVRGRDVAFLTAPVAGLGRSDDGQSIVRLDDVVRARLWQAVREDTVAAWAAEHPEAALGERVR